jgi:hypothetical protein
MTTLLLSRPLIYSCAIPLGIGLSLLHPSSPFRQPRLQCQYVAPVYNPHASSTETGWAFPVDRDPVAAKQGRTATTGTQESAGGILTASTMRQVSLGSVLGLAAGLGLRVFSKALVFFLGVGIVLVEVGGPALYTYPPMIIMMMIIANNTRANVFFPVHSSGQHPKATTSSLSAVCRNTSRVLICNGSWRRICPSRQVSG